MDVISVSRHVALMLFILGILAFVHNREKDKVSPQLQGGSPFAAPVSAAHPVTVALQDKRGLSMGPMAFFIATLLLVEDTVTFPAMLVAAYFFAPAVAAMNVSFPRRDRSGLKTITACFAISLAFLAYVKMSGAGRNYGLSYGWHSVQKLITLPRQMLQYLLVPDPTWGLPQSIFLRLLPMTLILGSGIGLLLTARKQERWTFISRSKPLVLFAFAWIFVTVLPYLSRPSGWTWFNRYLHFPSVGVLMLAGTFGEACLCRLFEVLSSRRLAGILMAGILGYMGIFGITSTILIRKEACRDSEPFCAVGYQEGQLLFGLLCGLRALKPAPEQKIRLMVQRSPFAPKRLQAMLDQYMGPDKVTLVEDASPPTSLGASPCKISFRDGRWENILQTQTQNSHSARAQAGSANNLSR